MTHLRLLFRSLMAILLLLLSAHALYAQDGYPSQTDPYVNDYAGLLTPENAANIRALLADFRHSHDIEAIAATINSISDYSTGDSTIESFATHLFNTWGIGDSRRNDGLLILVAAKDRKVRIEVGAGYDTSYNAKMQMVIDEYMLPAFRNNDYNRGIYNGARAMIQAVTGVWPADPDPLMSAPSAEPISGVILLGVGAVGAAGLGAAAVGIRRYRRYHPRTCPNCGSRMSIIYDNQYLDEGQRIEQMLGSVSYDVWECGQCGHHRVEGYPRRFSGLGSCPNCGYRTLRNESHTVVAATYSSTGEKRVTSDCQHCKYHTERTEILPMLVHSSSSDSSSSSSSGSSSSDSGGSSSGGGASGDW